MNELVILTGPTAVGKTGLSIRLAKELGGEIINADSMQVYKYMDIGSAKIKEDKMQGIRHHLLDMIEPTDYFSVYEFVQYAKAALDDIYSRRRLPILVGGTGFYIQALLKDVDFSEETVDDEYRRFLENTVSEGGPAALHGLLEEADPEAAAVIHANNVKRVMRALEYQHMNNAPISAHNEAQKQKPSPYNYAYFVLDRPRELLYERIDRRVDQMLEEGLLQETVRLREMGLQPQHTAAHGLGYRELLGYLDGLYDLEEAVRLIKRNTRHYAKRQLTWFRREKDVVTLDAETSSEDELFCTVNKILIRKGIVPVV